MATSVCHCPGTRLDETKVSDATSSAETLNSSPATERSTPAPPRDLEKAEDTSSTDDSSYEVAFSGLDDPDNPKSFSTARKWLITVVVAACSLCVTTNSTIYTFTYGQIIPEFNTSREVATVGLTTFVIGLGLGPLFLAPLSEFFGRRIIYLCAYSWILAFIIPCAVAQNIETILVTRFFDGLGASTFLSVAGGTIGDIWTKDKLSTPMMLYSGSPFLGELLQMSFRYLV